MTHYSAELALWADLIEDVENFNRAVVDRRIPHPERWRFLPWFKLSLSRDNDTFLSSGLYLKLQIFRRKVINLPEWEREYRLNIIVGVGRTHLAKYIGKPILRLTWHCETVPAWFDVMPYLADE